MTRKFSVAKSGDHAVGIKANDHAIAQIRWKWESEPTATSIKTSVEPYRG
jgi:hypothetical protein